MLWQQARKVCQPIRLLLPATLSASGIGSPSSKNSVLVSNNQDPTQQKQVFRRVFASRRR